MSWLRRWRCAPRRSPAPPPPLSSQMAAWALAHLFFDAAGYGRGCRCCPNRPIPKA